MGDIYDKELLKRAWLPLQAIGNTEERDAFTILQNERHLAEHWRQVRTDEARAQLLDLLRRYKC